jgi:tRNA G18 (ribose-2'-O)-methylase SpoU
LSLVLLSKAIQGQKKKPTKTRAPMGSSSKVSSSSSATEIMDSVDLDNRLIRKAEAVINWRTSRLVLVIERCTSDHNYSAILRSAEALGIQYVYMIDPPIVDYDLENDNGKAKTMTKADRDDLEARRLHHLFAQNATEWLQVKDFSNAEECVADLREKGYELWVTDLSQEAECLNNDSPAIPEKVALVMGTEAVGCSQYMLDQADKRVYLPLRGFADSLNLSVATALILHQLFLMDPTLIGAISEEEKLELRTEWFAKLCQQRLLPASEKKKRQRLLSHVRQCETLHERSQDPNYVMQAGEKKKLEKWPEYQKELAEIEAKIDPAKVKQAIQDWIDQPPEPLTDVRRVDSHRACFVGKGTKKYHKEHWKDMAATANPQSTNMATASSIREKLQQADGSLNKNK